MVTRRNSYTLVLHSHLFSFAKDLNIPRIIKQLIIVNLFIVAFPMTNIQTFTVVFPTINLILEIDFVMVCIAVKDCETHPSSLFVGL